MTRIFVPQLIPDGALERLRGLGDVVVFESLDRRIGLDELRAGVQGADVVVALGQIELDGETLGNATSCRLVAAMHSLANFVDIADATRRGIVVTGIPTDVSKTTAEFTFALMVGMSWRLAEADRFLREGRWAQNQSTAFLTSRLFGKTVGIVGMGIVGQGVAQRAKACDMNVVYHKRTRLSTDVEAELGARYLGLDDLFRTSDIVVLTVALTDETRGLVGPRTLSLMKRSAMLVNTSRGAVVDEEALERALRGGFLAGAALDVYDREPPDQPAGPRPGLLELPNVLVTPHIGTAARETRDEMAHQLVDNVEAFLAGHRPPVVLNPEVYDSGALRSPLPA